MTSIINEDGYRLNVGIIIVNSEGKVLLGRRNDKFFWQYPQGGIQPNESEEDAFHRELKEETGLHAQHVTIIWKSESWYSYRLPQKFIRTARYNERQCIGQKQRWFAARLLSDESHISLRNSEKPEFSQWGWFDMEYSISSAIYFKRRVYRQMIADFKGLYALPTADKNSE